MRMYLFIIAMCLSVISCGHKENLVREIIEKNRQHLSENITQVILVVNEEPAHYSAKLIAMQKNKNGWEQVFEIMPAGIGRNGFAAPDKKREGDGKSPSGIFTLGQLFTYESKVETQMPFVQSTVEDKWIDDSDSPDYNTHVRGETSAKSYEKLLLKSDYYKYCMVIDYNTNPVVKGKGSAIFFHLNKEKYEPTSGCVAISENDMLKILEWMKPENNPRILMGTREVLSSGL